MKKSIFIYTYHITTSNEDQRENLEQTVQFAAFANPIENEMLGVEWLEPIGEKESIHISDILHIEFLGKHEVVLGTKMDAV